MKKIYLKSRNLTALLKEVYVKMQTQQIIIKQEEIHLQRIRQEISRYYDYKAVEMPYISTPTHKNTNHMNFFKSQ